LNLKILLSTLIIALSSYQPAFAGANAFVSKSVRVGDNLISILRQNGFTQGERERVLASDKEFRNVYLTLDTKYLLRKTPTEIELRIFDSQTPNAFQIVKNKTRILARRYDPQYRTTVQRVDGKIHGSMLGSVLAKINSNWVATRFMDAYAFETKTGKKLRAGAPYSFLVEKKYEGVHFIKYGEILQSSLQIGNRTVSKHFVRAQGGGVFLDKEDLLESKYFFAPVDYLRIASHFQPNRRHPITKRLQPHLGVDFETPTGKNIYAPRSGIVVRYGRNHAAGNYVVIKHSQGIESSYNHMSKIDPKIRSGYKVTTGEVIGLVGNTGYSTRPHLHFAVRKNGRMIDPLLMMKAYPAKMEAAAQSRIASF